MNVKRILVTTLAGGMLLGSIGVYASNIPADMAQSSTAIKVEQLLEPAQEVKGDLPDNISFTDEGIAERIENLDDTLRTAKSSAASPLIEGIEVLKFSELSEELQDKLIENYGDLAYRMTFVDEEMAEKIANAEISVHMDNPSNMAISATKLITEAQEK